MVADDIENDEATSEIVKSDFYVDDLLFGANNVKTTSRTVNKLSTILQYYGFHFRKLRSNSTHLLES